MKTPLRVLCTEIPFRVNIIYVIEVNIAFSSLIKMENPLNVLYGQHSLYESSLDRGSFSLPFIDGSHFTNEKVFVGIL